MFKIRLMALEDVDKVFAIESNAHIAPWGLHVFYSCILAGFDCRILEVFDDVLTQGEMVGFLACKYNEKECHLLNLGVNTVMQERDFGRFLV